MTAAKVAGMAVDGLRPDQLPPRAFVEKRVDELLDLHGTRAAVTGGAGPNLGQAIVHRLAGLGASVAVIHRRSSADAARALATEAEHRWNVAVVPVEADVADWEMAHRAAYDVVEELGGLDVWINSAGSNADGGAAVAHFADYSQHAIDATVAGYLTPTLYGTHAALEVMLPQQHGRIINIASTAGLAAYKRHVAYGAMKAAIIAMTEFLAAEIGPAGVTIACVAPGTMVGDGMLAKFAQTDADDDITELWQEAWERTSIGRFCYPEEVANTVAFLASNAGAYIHGTTVRVAGGQ